MWWKSEGILLRLWGLAMSFSEENFILRRMSLDNMELVFKWRNKQHIRDNMYTDHEISPEEHEKWFHGTLARSDVDYRIFEYRERPLGLANATGIDQRNSKCSWGFYLGEDDGPRGVGAVMELVALTHIFEEIGVRKLCCEVFLYNKAAIKLHKKFGFQEEGYLRRHILKNGLYEDVVILTLFKKEWLELKNKMRKKIFGSDMI